MKTLSEHFTEIIEYIKIPQQSIDYAHLKISELNKKELNKILQKGGELVNESDLKECGDDIQEFVLGNKIYKICVREIKKKYYIINFYSPSVECVILNLELKEKKAHLTELLKQEGCLMQKKKNLYENIPKETGVLLMEIIIKVCKKFNMNEITLTDNSYIVCVSDPNARINLIYSKMMLDGESWYGKFGFEPKNLIDKKIYLLNQEKYKENIFTKEIKKEYFIKEIIDKEKNKNEIKNILKKYEEMKEEKICLFMKWISEKYCSIYSEIYEYIYKKIGYKKYSSLEFVLKLNTDSIDLEEFVNLVKNGKL